MSSDAALERWTHSHPFISFTLHLGKIPSHTWVRLGECSSKIEHIAKVHLRPSTANDLSMVFLIKGIHGTTAIEGNTLSEDQVKQRLDGNLPLPPSQEYLGAEIDNIVRAYHWLTDQIRAGAPLHVNAVQLKSLNSLVLEGLDVSDDVVPGEFRQHRVTVNDYLSPSPEFTDELVHRLCLWMNDPIWGHDYGSPHVLPILKAVLSHLYIAWIHPFGDGNGRTARLLEFDILTRAGVPPISAHLLSDHYNRTRSAYYRTLSAARRDPIAFVDYAVEGLVDGLREQVARIAVQQMQVTWSNFIHSRFRKLPGTQANRRRRDVAIQLGRVEAPVWQHEIGTLHPELAAAYVGSQRKLQRDLNFLIAEGLVLPGPTNGQFVANVELIHGFLPLRNTATSPQAS